MVEAKLSLSWDAYQKNICAGLSQLQQRGEFVDMTLAADGHLVKVHKMVLSLVSPYIKDLISSAECPHPVIFLNNVSYTTLCAILEYIYSGEVHVTKNDLSDLIAAGKALQIKGLREMNEMGTSQEMEFAAKPADAENATESTHQTSSLVNRLSKFKERKKQIQQEDKKPTLPLCKIFVDENDQDSDVIMQDSNNSTEDCKSDSKAYKTGKSFNRGQVQFTVSNQGGLQIVYNRFIYHFRYLQKSRVRLWRCIDYSSCHRCPARLFTNDNNEVTRRSNNHNHPFHDGKILKKIRLGIIYSAFQEAESVALSSKQQRDLPIDSDTQ